MTTSAAACPRPAPDGVGGAGQRRAQRAALGTTADDASTAGHADALIHREARRRDRRREAMRWRSGLWEWSSLPRLRHCGRVTHTGVGGPVVRSSGTEDGQRRAGVAGLQSCGSPWSCPVCARTIAAQRSTEVRDVLAAVADAGGSCALVTLTMRHRDGQALRTLWDALAAAWRAVTSGRQVEQERDLWGVLGAVRVVEATHGENGWHLHVHALVAFDGPVSRELAGELGRRWFVRWCNALVRRGLVAPLEESGGLDVRMVDMGAGSLDATADYLAKITAEVTASSAKDARGGNRSPFAVLRDALATGLADDIETWWEWEQTSRNRKQVTWTRGLREWAGVRHEREDQEIVDTDHQGEDVAAIEPEDWPRLRDRLPELLDVIEVDGPDAGRVWLTDHGIRWAVPRGNPDPGATGGGGAGRPG